MRALLGFGQAMTEPSAASLIGDYYPVDQRGRAREPEVQERHEALAAGQELGLPAVATEEGERLLHRPGRVVLEPGRLHATLIACAGPRR